MDERRNAGYTIVQSLKIGNAEFVIGHNPAAPAPYVTWECKDGSNYFWGHYMKERHQADRDLLERAGTELDLQDKSRNTGQKHKEKERER